MAEPAVAARERPRRVEPRRQLRAVAPPRAPAGIPPAVGRLPLGPSGGEPLPRSVAGPISASLGVDVSDVRVHADAAAASAAESVGARAFALGNRIFLGRRERATDLGLMAHEVAHVVQQRGAAVLQRWSDRGGDRLESEARRAATAVAARVPFSVRERTAPRVQRLGLSDALDYFADKANLIPGFRMFTIVLGVNPVNMSRVERSAANILRALIEVIPGGVLISQALAAYGIFDRIGTWVEQQIATLGMTGSMIRKAIDEFLRTLSWTDIFDLGGVWERAKRIFTEPIRRIIDFGAGLVTGIVRFVKEAILRPLAGLAEGTRGYDLLKAVLGQDPITGDPFPRTAETLIGGFMKLIGQEEIWENIKRANAIPRAWAWFQGALGGLLGFVRQIPSMFLGALQSLELVDIVLLPRAFAKLVRVFADFYLRFFSWAGQQVMSLLQIIFEVVAPGVMPYIRKAMGAFRTIIADPIRFIGHLVRAGVQGFRQFAAGFLGHLRKSLIQWITGAMSGANIYIPQAFELREIIKFVLSVLGLTWQTIRAKLVRVIGATAVQALETGLDIVVTLVREGPAAAWDKIREQISNLRDMVMEQVMTFVRDRIVTAAITRLVTSLNPAGAFIQAIIAIYNTVMFVVERLRQIGQVVASFIDSISAIASGAIGAAANRVEQTMGGLLTLVISFLARLIGLGRVSDVVVNIVNRIRAPIDRALDRVVDWIVATARRLGRLVVSGARAAVSRLVNWAGLRKGFRTRGGETHSLFARDLGGRPVLVIATDEKPFADYLAQLEVPATDTARTAAKRVASESHQAINTKLGELKTMEASVGPNPTSAQRGVLNRKQDEIRLLYDTLATQVVILGIGAVRAETVQTRVHPASGSKLQALEAKPLTALRGNTVGNPAANSVRSVPGWAFLDQINLARSQDNTIYNEWVRWHLVHSGLHGPAAVFNLVAAPRGANTRFNTQVEQSVLRLVLQPGALLYFKVTVAYDNATAPLDDFPTSISYVWGKMKLGAGNAPEEDGQLGGPVTFSGFTMPTLPTGTPAGPAVIRLKNVGRPGMTNPDTLRIAQDPATRIARACSAYPSEGVHAAMDAYYARPDAVFKDVPYARYLAADKAAIAAAQVRVHGRFTIDLT